MKYALYARLVPFLCVPTLLAAQSDPDPRQVQPERPTVATHAGTVAPGYLEVEVGGEYDLPRSGDHALSFPFIAKIGIGSTTQLGIFGAPNQPPGASLGVGDLGAGVKWRLADDLPVLGRFAILPSVTLPTGSVSAGSGTGTTATSLLLISSHDVAGVALDINAGYTHRTGDGTAAPVSSTVWTVSTGGSFTDILGWVFETFGYPGTSGPSGSPASTSILFGPTFASGPTRAFDFGMIQPLHGGDLRRAFYAGGVFNFGRIAP